jgi:hypothetical protein
MDPILLAVLALSILAIALRSLKARDRIDWKSRVELLLLSTCICLIVTHWMHSSLQEAAEMAATTGRSVHHISMSIAPHYDPMLTPVYVAITAVLIDLISRIFRRLLARRSGSEGRRLSLWRTVCANVVVFVAAPSLLYAWTIAFATSGSMMSDAGQQGVTPFIVAYAAPAHRLESRTNDGGATREETLGEHSQSDPRTEWTLRARLWKDAAPWFAFAVIFGCIAALPSKEPDRRTFFEYLIRRDPSSPTILSVRSLMSTWRSISVVCFTAAWVISAAISQLLLHLVLGLQYIWIPLLMIVAVAILVGIPAVIFNILRSRRSKRPVP